MALPVIADLKAVLRIQTTAEDTLLQGMLNRATSLVVAYLGRPYEAVARTWVDDGGLVRAYASLRALFVPVTPFDPASLVIEDADGEILVVGDDYRAPRSWDGIVRAAPGTSFANPPYTLTANVGLVTSYGSDGQVDYATVIEPTLSQAIIDTVADWYQRRNPAATSETTGGGVSTSWDAKAGLPERVCMALDPYKAVRAVWAT